MKDKSYLMLALVIAGLLCVMPGVALAAEGTDWAHIGRIAGTVIGAVIGVAVLIKVFV